MPFAQALTSDTGHESIRDTGQKGIGTPKQRTGIALTYRADAPTFLIALKEGRRNKRK